MTATKARQQFIAYYRRIVAERKARWAEERRRTLGTHPSLRRERCEKCGEETIHVKAVCCHH